MRRAGQIPCLVPALVLLVSTSAFAQEQDRLIQVVRDGNAAAIQAMRTIECNYLNEVPGANPKDEYARQYHDVGKYIRSGDTIYSLQTPADTHLEHLVRDGMIWTLSTDVHRDRTASRFLTVGRFETLSRGDVCHFALLTHWGGRDTMRCWTFAEILSKTQQIHAAQRFQDEGRELVYVKLTALRGVHEFWFDPAVNYLIRKKTWTSTDDPKTWHEEKVRTLTEVNPGVYFPTETELIHHRPDVDHPAVVRKMTDLRINHSIPPDRMRLPNIKGLKCYNSDRKVNYTVDDIGERVGPEKPEQTQTVPLKGMIETPLPVSPSPEPIPLTTWMLAFSCLVVVGAGILWWLTRREDDE